MRRTKASGCCSNGDGARGSRRVGCGDAKGRRTAAAPRRVAISFAAPDQDSVLGQPAGRPPFGTSRELALRVAEVISDTPAANTVVLDIQAISPMADYFVICSGENERQLRAIARDVQEKLAAAGVRPERSEGTAPGGWILLDYGDVIVHVFDVDQRAFYRLEELWSEAPTLLSIQ